MISKLNERILEPPIPNEKFIIEEIEQIKVEPEEDGIEKKPIDFSKHLENAIEKI